MANEKILVIEDEPSILELLKFNLAKNGYKVIAVESAEEALDIIDKNTPDLIILDLMLPGMDGLEFCKKAKTSSKTSSISIVMLTAKGEESDIVTGLELGADDYIVKPFSPKVLIARVRNVLRRKSIAPNEDQEQIKINNLIIHTGKHEVNLNKSKLDLTATEFQILHYLSKKPGWVFTRGQIVNNVQGPDFAVTDRTIDVHVASLRKKLGENSDYIETVRGVGYKIRDLDNL